MKKDLLNHLNALSTKKTINENISDWMKTKELQEESENSVVTSSTATATSKSKKGKDLTAFDPDDPEHNLEVYKTAMNRYGEMKRAGQISKQQYLDIQGQLQGRVGEFIKDKEWEDKVKAVEQGIDMAADVLGMVPGLGDVVDAAHTASYAARGYVSGDDSYYDKAKDQAIYGLLLPAGVGAAVKGAAKATTKAAETGASTLGKIAGEASQKTAEKLIDKATKVASKAMDVNPYGAVAGGIAGMQAAPQDASLGTKLAYGFGGSILVGNLVKAGNKIPGLGKVIQEPSGSLSYYAGKGAGIAAKQAQNAASKIPDPLKNVTIPELPKAVADKVRTGLVSLSLATQAPAAAGPVANVMVSRPQQITATTQAPKAEAPNVNLKTMDFVAPKAEAPKAEAPKAEAPKAEAPKAEVQKTKIDNAKNRSMEDSDNIVSSKAADPVLMKNQQVQKNTSPAPTPTPPPTKIDNSNVKPNPKTKGKSKTKVAPEAKPIINPEVGGELARQRGFEKADFEDVDTAIFQSVAGGRESESLPNAFRTKRTFEQNEMKNKLKSLIESQKPMEEKPARIPTKDKLNEPVAMPKPKDSILGDASTQSSANLRDNLIRKRSAQTKEKYRSKENQNPPIQFDPSTIHHPQIDGPINPS